MTAHANCTHPATKAARAACRRNAARIADARNTPIDIDGMTVKYHSSPIVKEVEVGHLLITPKGVAEVKKIDYANPIMRTGWKFTMSDGEEMIFSLHNETVIRMIEV